VLPHVLFSFFNLGHRLSDWVHTYRAWIYPMMFLVLFAETGLVILPFLPGDSLLLVAGTLVAQGTLSASPTLLALLSGAILGNLSNYALGAWAGPKVFHYERSRWFNPDHLREAHAFFQRYGASTIVMGRLIPIIRTFVPFVAGIGRMSRLRFVLYTLYGGGLWVGLLFGAGYYFGNVPVVRANLPWGILTIAVLSLIPVAVHGYRAYRRRTTFRKPDGVAPDTQDS
jgi:membrane-associated protein